MVEGDILSTRHSATMTRGYLLDLGGVIVIGANTCTNHRANWTYHLPEVRMLSAAETRSSRT